ncbi:hypothetical protein KGP36_04230 [Patescibacteria group bacterium]|nr:hypothetical protein [Patescibacteria group bacterium]
MDNIFCLMVDGGKLSDEARNSLLMAAQKMLTDNVRVSTLDESGCGLRGSIGTEYKYGIMGSIGGIIFNAQFYFRGRLMKVEFITRPIKDLGSIRRQKWRPLLAIAEPDLALN